MDRVNDGAGWWWGATPEEVDAAVKKAVGYLYSQRKNGNWEAVATCALLYAGESPQQKERDLPAALVSGFADAVAEVIVCQVRGVVDSKRCQ